MAKDYVLNIIIKASDQANSIVKSVAGSVNAATGAVQNFGNQAQAAGAKASNAFNQTKERADQLNKKLQEIGDTLVGAGTAAVGFGAALAAPFGLAVKSAGDFQHAMNKVAAVADMTDKDLGSLANKARDLGANTQYSSTQAVGGMLELSRAGYKAEQVLSSIIPILNLAAAEELNMGQVAEGLVNILQGFGLGADQATRAADVLSKTSNETTTSMNELVDGMKYAAPVAAAMGMNIEQTSAYLGILSNAGIRGAMAGTGLRRVIERLVDPTREAQNVLSALGVEIAKNASGQVNITETFKRLAAASMSASDAFQIFGVHGATDALVIAKNISGLEELTQKNNDAVGSLQKMVDTINSGVTPAFNHLKNAANEMMISFGEPFLKVVKIAVDGLASVLNWLSNLGKQFPILAGLVGGAAGVIGVLIVVLGTLLLTIGGSVLAIRQLINAWQFLIRAKNEGIVATVRGTQALQAETAAINANTVAKQRNAAVVPSTGPTSPRGIGGLGRGFAIAGGIAGVAGGIAEMAMSESALGKISGLVTGISGGLMFIPHPIAQIAGLIGMTLGSVGKLVDSFGLFGSKTKEVKTDTEGVKDAQDGVSESTNKMMAECIDLDRSFLDFKNDYEKATGEKITAREMAAWSKVYEERVLGHQKALKQIGANEAAAQAQAQKSPFGANVEEIARTFDVLTKEAESYYAEVDSLRKASFEKQKNDIYASTQSQQLAKMREMQAETAAATQAIATAEQRFNATRQLREMEYQESLRAIEKLNKAEQAEARSKLEKKHSEDKIADEKKYTASLIQELDTQLKARQRSIEEIQRLEAQASSERQGTRDALTQVTLTSVSEYDKLKISVADAQTKLIEATNLMPTMPERALELAKQAQQSFSSLGQNVTQLQENLRSNALLVADAQRSIATSGLTGVAKWKAEIQDVQVTLARARREQASGNVKEAENFYKQALSQAKSIATSAPEGLKYAGRKEASALASEAGTALLGLNAKQVEEAKTTNQTVTQGITKASEIVQSLIQAQINSHQQNIAALDRNTAALVGKIQTPSRPEAERLGVAGETPPSADTERYWYGKEGTPASSPPGIMDNIAAMLSNLSQAISDKISGYMPTPGPVTPPVATEWTVSGGDVFQDAAKRMLEAVSTFSNNVRDPIKIQVTATGGASVASIDMWGR